MATVNSRDYPAVSTTAPSAAVWTPFLLLCLIAAAAAIRRIVALINPPNLALPQRASAALDLVFASHKVLTLCHIVPALLFIAILPFWFLRRVRNQPALHRRITYALLLLGSIIGATALLLSLHPVGGPIEASASILYDCLFLFSLCRAAFLLGQNNLVLHRIWMMRAIAVLLGIATTRPVMGVFFATSSVTHLQPQQFFGIAFWIGFTVTWLAGEAYLRSHPTAHPAQGQP
ncbi:MAG TPA: DUF2306 domain-containing protein [Terracidiphilus sp.]|jgi:hypothetical protein